MTLVLWPLLYFALFDRVGRLLATNGDLLRRHREQAQWVTLAAFVLALLAVEGLVFVTLGEPRTTTGIVREKLLRFDRFRHPDRWRLVLNGEDYFHIPYSDGMKIEKGHAESFTHRDAWLGVRIVTSYDLGR
jgi:hypothetical protein